MVANRLGIHAGVWGFDWAPRAADRAIREAAEAGYDLIEIPAIDRTELDAADTRRSLERHGIDAVVSRALGFADDINGVDPVRSARGEYRLTEAVAFASEIGAAFVGGVVYSAMGRYEASPDPSARANSLSVLRRVAAIAGEYGITLGIEYVNRYESNLLNTAAQTVEFIEALGAPNVVLHLDTFHAGIEEASLRHAVRDAGPNLGYVHVSESHRGALGTGAFDWAGFAEELVACDYAGPLTVETFSSAVVDERAAVDIGLWRPMWADPAQVAADSLAFLRAHLAPAHHDA